MKKRVLILGGCGYIGSALAKFLRSENYGVQTVDTGWFGDADDFAFCADDYRSFTCLPQELSEQCDAIVLLAGHSSVPMAIQSGAPATLKNNVQNFVLLLDRLERLQAKGRPTPRLIYASSSGIYGGQGGRLCTEEDDLGFRPTNVYDLSKWEIDQYARLSPLDLYGLRFGTVNGPSPNFRNDVMLNRMWYTAKTEGKITVRNPQIWRPILALFDLCRAVRTVIDSPVRAPGVYNLASFNATVAELAREAGRLLQVPVEWEGPTPAYDMRISTEKFRSTFGWGPALYSPHDVVAELRDGQEDLGRGRGVKVDYA